MSEEKKNIQEEEKQGYRGVNRRDVLKSLATIPVLGAFAYGVYQKKQYDRSLRENYSKLVNISGESPSFGQPVDPNGQTIRLGLIGYGIRGKALAQAAGFVPPETLDKWKKAAKGDNRNTRYADFQSQEDLNVVVNGVCDIFDTYGEMAQAAAANKNREGSDKAPRELVKRYRTYQELMAAPDIDAVIIAAPDHWHGPMTIEAAKQKKHVYCEKPMTWTVEETYQVREVVKDSGIVFQLGHQGRQTDSYLKAQEAVSKGVLGPISLIEITTNRNTANGAWVYPIIPGASPQTIDWKQFIGQAPWHDFDLERFFRWRCWWDYSTGLSGDLLTHEYDAINQIMDVGIPDSAMSTGGIYFWKDGRTVPDVLTTAFEFKEKDLTLLYSATLASEMTRGKRVMGHDAYMDLSDTLLIYADPKSTKYEEEIKSGQIKPELPIYSFIPGKDSVDGVTTATEAYFAKRGLLYTYRDGKRVNTTHLHIKEWLEAIRGIGKTSCDIDQGFEEAMTAHMGTLSYKHQKKVFWDPGEEKIIV